MENDSVNHPSHYTGGEWTYKTPECIDISRFLSFCIGNAVKYVWRAGLKGDAQEDLDKALWYLRQPRVTTGMEISALRTLFMLVPGRELEQKKYDIIRTIIDPNKPDWLAESMIKELKSWLLNKK